MGCGNVGELFVKVKKPAKLNVTVPSQTGGGTGNYNLLTNKPSINGVELFGNVTSQQLGIVSDLTYVYKQLSPAASWTITHNLGKYPSVSVADSAGNTVIGEVNYVNENSLVVTFSAQFAGVAYLN